MPTSTAGNSNSQTGFTLVELCVVIVLLSLFSLVSIPLFSHTGQGALHASARKLAGTVKYLFNEAALTGQEHRLVYNLDRGSYRAVARERDGDLVHVEGIGKETLLPERVHFKRLSLPGRGSFTAGEVTVRIHPSGWLEETIVQLTGSDETTLTLRINPLTGSTEIFDGAREF